MALKKINDDFFVEGQITVTDISAIKQAGIASIICNRPDGESDGQPSFKEIAAAAKVAGISIIYNPLAINQAPTDEVMSFVSAYTELPKPILGYCRSGTRSTTLWSLAQLGTISNNEIISTARAAGYDMTKVINASVIAG